MTGQNFLKGSKNTSAQPKTTSAAQSSNAARNPHSRAIDGFALTGPSTFLDPRIHAYRKDLADTGLAGQVIASHYAEPLVRHLISSATMLASPGKDSEPLAELRAGDEMRVLDISLGWAWGYGPDGRVGYVLADAVGA
jgi:hypothetical protein